MKHLEVERAVAEGVATLYALGAADSEVLSAAAVVFALFLDGALAGSRGGALISGASAQRGGLGLEVAGAQLAIAAYVMGVDALDG